MKVLGYIALFLIIATTIMLSNAIMFFWMWKWFIVPFGIVQLSWMHLMGLAAFVGYLTTHSYKPNKDASTNEKLTEIISAIIRPWVVLLYGYIFYCMM